MVPSGVDAEDEACAFGELGVDVELAVHLHGHLLADGQSKAIACGKVLDFDKGLEDVLAHFLRDDGACVGDDELELVYAPLLELQADVAALGGMLGSAHEQMVQDVCDHVLVEGGSHLGYFCAQDYAAPDFVPNLVHEFL